MCEDDISKLQRQILHFAHAVQHLLSLVASKTNISSSSRVCSSSLRCGHCLTKPKTYVAGDDTHLPPQFLIPHQLLCDSVASVDQLVGRQNNRSTEIGKFISGHLPFTHREQEVTCGRVNGGVVTSDLVSVEMNDLTVNADQELREKSLDGRWVGRRGRSVPRSGTRRYPHRLFCFGSQRIQTLLELRAQSAQIPPSRRIRLRS